jgi:hypothetical protein
MAASEKTHTKRKARNIFVMMDFFFTVIALYGLPRLFSRIVVLLTTKAGMDANIRRA